MGCRCEKSGQSFLQIEGFAGGEQAGRVAGGGGVAGEGGGVDADFIVGVVVQPHGEFGAEQVERVKRVGGPHGVKVADGDEREIEAVAADEAHVAEERGVAGVVERAAGGFDKVTAGDAHGLGFAVAEFEGGAVNGRRHLDAAPREIDAAAGHEVEGGGISGVGGEVFGECVGCDDGGVVEAGEGERVADVVAVGVRAEHVVAGDVRGFSVENRIFREVGIDDEPNPGDFDAETGMTERGDSHELTLRTSGREPRFGGGKIGGDEAVAGGDHLLGHLGTAGTKECGEMRRVFDGHDGIGGAVEEEDALAVE